MRRIRSNCGEGFSEWGQQGSIAFLATLLILAIMGICGLIVLGKISQPRAVDQKAVETQAPEGEGLDDPIQISVLESTSARIKKMEQQQLQRPNEILDMMKGNNPEGN